MQRDYHNPGSGYNGTLSQRPKPLLNKTTNEHKGAGKGKDIKTRNHCFGITDCEVIRADGTRYTIARTRSNATAKSRTRKAAEVANKVTEIQQLGAKLHKKLSMDEIRAKNGL